MAIQKYKLDVGWLLLLNDLNIAPEDLLRKAQLPASMMNNSQVELSVDEYYRLWESLVTMSDDDAFPLKVVQAISPEMFNPPMFASLCSPNFVVAVQRLKQYKPLIGPMTLELDEEKHSNPKAIAEKNTVITLAGLPKDQPLPVWLSLMELLFFVHLLRIATREHVIPVRVELAHDVKQITNLAEYTDFLGVDIVTSDANRIVLSHASMQMPFMTVNDALWQVFEPDLRRRLHELDASASFKERIRAYLFETIASGEISMQNVAAQLAMSPRTMQRRLKEEDTNFQQELAEVRKDLATHYLNRTDYSSAEIAFLLGYDDPNSFFRAFNQWTGQTPEAVRKNAHEALTH